MMKTILASTAAAALLAGSVYAQTEPAETAPDAEVMEQQSDDVGGATTPPEIVDDTTAPDVEDPAMADEGAMEPADPAMTEDAAPADPMMTDDADTATDPMMTDDAAPADPMAAPADPMMAEDPAMADPAANAVNITEVSTDRLTGANITTMDGETIASVEDVIITDDGQVESLVAQFGGFLGFGSNQVLLTPDEVTLMEDENGALLVQTSLTPESIEGRPAYEE